MLAEIVLLQDEVAPLPVKLASLSQLRQNFGSFKACVPTFSDTIFTTLLKCICTTSYQPLLAGTIDTFSTVLIRSSQPPLETMLAVCSSVNSICGAVLTSSGMVPTFVINIEVSVEDPELSVRILQLLCSSVEKLASQRINSERGLGADLDGFLCYVFGILNHILLHCTHWPVYHYALSLVVSILTFLIPRSRTIAASTLKPLVSTLINLITEFVMNPGAVLGTNGTPTLQQRQCSIYQLLTNCWACVAHIFSIYQDFMDQNLAVVQSLACKSLMVDASPVLLHCNTSMLVHPLLSAFSTHISPFYNLLPRSPGGFVEAFFLGPVTIFQTVLSYGSMQTSDLIAESFFGNKEMATTLQNIIRYGCCIDLQDLHNWMESPFEGALVDVSGGKLNEFCDFIVECFFGFQSFLISNFISTLHESVNLLKTQDASMPGYFETVLSVDSILTVFGHIWPSLTIDTEATEMGAGSTGTPGASIATESSSFLFEHAYSVFDSLFITCSTVLRQSTGWTAADRKTACFGGLIFLRRLAHLLNYISAFILPDFVDTVFNLLHCYLQAPLLVQSSPSAEESIESYIGLQILAANAASTMLADMSGADLQREALLETKYALQFLHTGIQIIVAALSGSACLLVDGYLDVHIKMLENCLVFINVEQDRIALDQPQLLSTVVSLGNLVVAISGVPDQSAAFRRLLRCYKEALLIHLYFINTTSADQEAVRALLGAFYTQHIESILPLAGSSFANEILDIIGVSLSIFELCPSFEGLDTYLTSSALIAFQIERETAADKHSKEMVRTHIMATDTIQLLLQMYPRFMLTGNSAVTSHLLFYFFGLSGTYTDMNCFYHMFSTLIEVLTKSGELIHILCIDNSMASDIPRIRAFMDRYAYLEPEPPFVPIETLMDAHLPISAVLLYLALRCAATGLAADSYRSTILRSFCYIAFLVYSMDIVIDMLGLSDQFMTVLRNTACNVLSYIGDAAFSQTTLTIFQLFVLLEGYQGFGSQKLREVFGSCRLQLAEAIERFKKSNEDETDQTYHTIVSAIKSLVVAAN